MGITIENPTAEAIISEIKRQIPAREFERLRALFIQEDPSDSSEWSEEDLQDASRATGLLIDEGFGPEEGNYD